MISKREATLNYLILGVFAIIALFPLLGVITSALTDPTESSASLTFPSSPHFGNFVTAWNEDTSAPTCAPACSSR